MGFLTKRKNNSKSNKHTISKTKLSSISRKSVTKSRNMTGGDIFDRKQNQNYTKHFNYNPYSKMSVHSTINTPHKYEDEVHQEMLKRYTDTGKQVYNSTFQNTLTKIKEARIRIQKRQNLIKDKQNKISKKILKDQKNKKATSIQNTTDPELTEMLRQNMANSRILELNPDIVSQEAQKQLYKTDEEYKAIYNTLRNWGYNINNLNNNYK